MYFFEMSIEKINELSNMEIKELMLSVRSYNLLRRAGYETVGELACATIEMLTGMDGMGEKTLYEILKSLEEWNITIPTEAEKQDILMDMDKIEVLKIENEFLNRRLEVTKGQLRSARRIYREVYEKKWQHTKKECENSDVRLNSPQKIYEWLEKHICGQEKAVKAAAMLLYNHIQGRKRNILFIGPTGCGKTEIWRVCWQIYPHIRIVDGTMITGEGWSGSFKVKNIFDDMEKQDAEKAIIVIDEFDKLCERQIGSSGTNYSQILQNNLLKLIEGTDLSLKDYTIDTSKISFVFCGSFERLTEMKTASEAGQSIGFGANLKKPEACFIYEDVIQPADLVKYADMRQEIAGRIHQIVQLLPMTADDYKEILSNDQISPLRQIERQYGVKLCLDRETEQKLVQEAEETHMGVRYLRSRIQQMLDDQMFQDCDRTEYRLSA